jgi:hypothetical protein
MILFECIEYVAVVFDWGKTRKNLELQINADERKYVIPIRVH